MLVEAVRNAILQPRGINTYQDFVERHRRAMETAISQRTRWADLRLDGKLSCAKWTLGRTNSKGEPFMSITSTFQTFKLAAALCGADTLIRRRRLPAATPTQPGRPLN
jgi:hypothetical protein